MFRCTSLVIFIVLTLTDRISAELCYDANYASYYCSPGQSCGSYYGDCRGLPTYALISIISSGLLLLLICIRCCIYLSSNNTRATPRRVLISAQNPRLVRVQTHPYPNNLSTGSPTAVPVHIIKEEAPPSYIVATSSTIEPPKY